MNRNKIHVFTISQQVVFRRGVEAALSSIKDIENLGSADFNNGVPFDIEEAPPDVVILDIDAPSHDSMALSRVIKQHLPNIGIIMLTACCEDAQLFEALKSHAAAYCSKEINLDDLVNIIRRVGNGEHPINESLTSRPDVANKVLQQFRELSLRSETDGFISPLTPRETEILNYMAQGFLNRQIGVKLNTSEQTIKNHITSILRKLNANARTEAVVIAIKRGLVSLG